MSVSVGNSSIVTQGLTLHLDAASSLNYRLSTVEVLVVGGGGAGGQDFAGGGGGGGVVYNSSFSVTPGSAITVIVGNGGTRPSTSGAVNGQNSVFSTITAIGGGGGGGSASGNAGSGGSGGGASYGYARGTGTSGQGYDGEAASVTTSNAAGGGGAGGTGYGGNGGPGLPFTISGTLRYYAGGGGGCGGNAIYYKGGIGGGGTTSGYQTGDGVANTGGGGGAFYGSWSGAGSGGSGIVIVRYPGPQKATGGNTITQVDGYTIHTFTSSGTFTPLSVPSNGGSIYGLQDLTGNANTPIAINGPTYSTANNGSIVFDGTNDYFQVTNNNGFDLVGLPPTISLELWANITRRSGSGALYQQLAGFRNDTNFSFFFLLLDGVNATVPTEARILTTGGTFDINVPYISYFNTWTHIVFTANVNRTDLYFNGSLAGSNTNVTGSFGASSGNFRVGLSPAGAWPTQGNISSVRVYNRALTASEIQQNFNAQRGRFGI